MSRESITRIKVVYDALEELDDLVMEKLSAVLSEKQKKVKVNNLISSLGKEGRIENAGSDTKPKWVLKKN